MPKGTPPPDEHPSRQRSARATPSEELLRQQFVAGKRKRPTLASAGSTAGLKIGTTDRRFEETQAQIASQGVGLPYINLFGFPVELAALKLVERDQAIKAETAPFIVADKQVRIATTNPQNPGFKKIIGALTKQGYRVKSYYVSPSSLKHILDFYANLIVQKEPATTQVSISEEDLARFRSSVKSLREIQERASSATVTEMIDILVAAALQLESTDIHLEPTAGELRVRYRLDGLLHDAAKLPLGVHKQLVNRIKLLSKLKLNVTQVAQDGRFTITTKERPIDVRVSILPSQYGEAVVMRLLGVGAVLLKVADLGLRDTSAKIIAAELKKPNGMILTTGPTGSGKTTTLYSFVNQLNSPEVKIITLEDPIEYRISGLEQTQVDETKGYSFARGLHSILRQDPDVLLIGEIRDLETAETAVSAALTGHIVFSTLHTNDAAGALPRLIDMGVRPFVLAPAINAVIAQRLIRKVCTACLSEHAPTDTERQYIASVLGPKLLARLPQKYTLAIPKGCKVCNFLGYKGRTGVFEVFRIDDAMEKLILGAASTAEIRETAVAQGMLLMKQDGVLKAIDHITTLEEVERVV
ncbi:MAG: ATPase, T2SS/T4P/T4SS family [Parcubacteria group bacterium]